MTEERIIKRRNTIKNIAIAFLAIMLLLTFFSNTIMNYSLPEVAAQYPRGGVLSEQIRGSGVVEASENYDVMTQESRTIESVLVKVGDPVEKGQKIILLEDKDSDELTMAKDKLAELNLAYNKALIDSGNDYALENLAIKNIEDDIKLAKADLPKIDTYKQAYDDAKKLTQQKKETLRELKDELDALSPEKNLLLSKERMALIEPLNKKVETAQKAKDKAAKEIEEYTALSNGVTGAEGLAAKKAAIEAQEDTISALRNQLARAHGKPDEFKAINEQLNSAESQLNKLRSEYSIAASAAAEKSGYETRIRNSLYTFDKESKRYDDAVKALNDCVTLEVAKLNREITKAQDEFDEATSDEAEALAKSKLTVEEVEANIRKLERDLDNAKATLEATQRKNADDKGLINLDVKAMQDNIKKQEELIAKLTEKSIGTAITANVSGIVRQLNCAAGLPTKPTEPLMTIEVAELGYTLSFAVTNEQAQKVRVGDLAEVLYYWGGNAEAKLAGIKPDTANPNKSKILVFNISGDIQPGQQLNLQMGAKGQNYETILPNSAIREDNNGKFVLTIVSKSSPLGNRYIAERTDVTVLVTDGTNSAVTGAFGGNGYGQDFILTTATKPVNPGDQVRLANT